MSTGTAVATAETHEARLYESLALKGDISGLTPAERVAYYIRLCERIGLDPYTQPLLPLKLNGKEILYASRGATDQMAAKHGVTREIVNRERVADVYVVTARATLPSGRHDDSTGAVALGRLAGEALANALMKAETKAKRRATLSLLGLGLLDESEMDTIPAAFVEVAPPLALGAEEPEAAPSTPPADVEWATPKQIGFGKRLLNSHLFIDSERRAFGAHLDRATKAEAKDLIDRIQAQLAARRTAEGREPGVDDVDDAA